MGLVKTGNIWLRKNIRAYDCVKNELYESGKSPVKEVSVTET